MRLVIVRHGERLDNVQPRWTNTAERPHDPPLTDRGREQADATGRHLGAQGWAPDGVLLLASPFLRTMQTAHAIAQHLRVPIHVCPGIAEFFSSTYFHEAPEVLGRAALCAALDTAPDSVRHEDDIGLATRHPVFPEHINDAVRRLGATFDAIRAHAEEHSLETVVMVSHGYSAQIIAEHFDPDSDLIPRFYRAPYCNICEVEIVANQPRLLRMGDDQHLAPRLREA